MAKLTPEQVIQRLLPKPKAGQSNAPSRMVLTYNQTVGKNNVLYIIDNETSGKSYLCPADDRFPSSIGEWDTTVKDMPPSLVSFLSSYESIINSDYTKNASTSIVDSDASVVDNMDSPSKAKANTESFPDEVKPLIKSKWGQKTPYNRNLVMTGSKEGIETTAACFTGCAATACSQWLLYWSRKGYRFGCTNVKSRTFKYYNYTFTLPGLSSTPYFDYEHMTYDKPISRRQKKAVASILEHVGKALNMAYSPIASGSNTSDELSLIQTGIRFCKAATHPYGLSSWQLSMKRNLAKGYPVLINGPGHAFICDGYKPAPNSDDATAKVYHFNFGWYGNYDGDYYLPNDITPGSYDYSSGTNMIYGPESNNYLICPDYLLGDVLNDGDVGIEDLLKVASMINKGEYSDIADTNYDKKVSYEDMEPIAYVILKTKDFNDPDNAASIKAASIINVAQSCKSIAHKLERLFRRLSNEQ